MNRRFVLFATRRLLFTIPQLLVVSLIVFFLIRLLPGDPSYSLAGPYASPERIVEVRTRLGLDQPLVVQYLHYLGSVLTGDFGISWRTSQPVLADIQQRLPATLELVVLSVFFSILIGIPLGVAVVVSEGGILKRLVFLYGMMAGSLPDFWIGLLLILVFFYLLGWAPAPVGQLDFAVSTPEHITGAYALDALLTGDWEALRSSVAQLVLPVATLVLVYMPLVLKTTRSTMEEMVESHFILQARASGLSAGMQLRYALRNALPAVITVIGIEFWFLLGGAVLVETIFAWGGLGQYAVESVVNSDYAPLQAVVLVTAFFTTLVFLLVDLLYHLLDPRISV